METNKTEMLNTMAQIFATGNDDEKAVASILYSVLGSIHSGQVIKLCFHVNEYVVKELKPYAQQQIHDRKVEKN